MTQTTTEFSLSVPLEVHKYGGTSVGDVERMGKVASRVARAVQEGSKVVVVVSAMGSNTDHLVALAREINPRPHRRELDMLMTTGEQQSIALLTMALHKREVKALSFTGQQAGFLTDSISGEANILQIDPEPLFRALQDVDVCVVAGFQGVDGEGMITTLGRGGSDTTAVALAAALEVGECSIFTDTEGVYTTDPHVVPQARKLEQVDYDEMLQLASLGARVLHPRAVWYARQHNVTVHVRSSFSFNQGTLIRKLVSKEKTMRTDQPVTGIALDDTQSRLNLYNIPDTPGTAAQIFQALAQAGIAVDMVIQGIAGDSVNEQQMAFIVQYERRLDAVEVVQAVLSELGGEVRLEEHVARLSVVGIAVGSTPSVPSTMFSALADIGINIEMISSSEVRISAIIPAKEGKRALRTLHTAFGLDADG